MLQLKVTVGGIPNQDPHVDAFISIASESDHLPLKAQQHLWSVEAIAELQPDFERTERWAATFVPSACHGLIWLNDAVICNSSIKGTHSGVLHKPTCAGHLP